MENKKTLLLGTVAVFIALLLIGQDYSNAQISFTDLSVTNNPAFVYAYNNDGVNYLAVARVTANNEALNVYNIDTGALIRTISLATLTGNGLINDMYCLASHCYFYGQSVSSGAGSADVFGYNFITGTLIGRYNYTAPYVSVAGGALVVTGDIEDTIWTFVTDGSDTYYEVLSASTNPFTRVSRIDTNVGNNGVLDAEVATISGTNVLTFTTAGATAQLQIWNRGTSAQVCASGNVGTTHKDIELYGSTWYISDNEEIEIYNNSCTDIGTITASNLCDAGGTEPVRSIAGSTFRGEIYANCDQSVTNPRIVVVNASTSTRTTSLFLAGNANTGVMHGAVVYNRNTDTLTTVMTSSNQVRIYYFGSPIENSNGGNSSNGRCGVGTVLDCVGNGTSPFAGITGGQNATIITAQLTNGIGITHCSTTDDSDAETCGSGLFMFAFLILLLEFLALAGYLGMTAKLNADRTIVDVALIMGIIGFVSVAIGFYLNWIPDLVFYTIIVLIAGLATFGILGKIRGSE